MRLLSIALFFALSTVASASTGKVVVTCTNLPFSDLAKIEIQETDLKGQYQIVETTVDTRTKKETVRLTAVFGTTEFEKSEFPELTSWNGYTRELVRYGRENYSLTIEDECSQAVLAISCKETF